MLRRCSASGCSWLCALSVRCSSDQRSARLFQVHSSKQQASMRRMCMWQHCMRHVAVPPVIRCRSAASAAGRYCKQHLSSGVHAHSTAHIGVLQRAHPCVYCCALLVCCSDASQFRWARCCCCCPPSPLHCTVLVRGDPAGWMAAKATHCSCSALTLHPRCPLKDLR